MKLTYKHTRIACYAAFVVLAIVVNLVPLFFVSFRRMFGLSLEQLGLLVSVNFCVQLIVDFIAAHYADRLGYRRAMVLSQIFAAAGIVLIGVLPFVGLQPFTGLLLSVACMAVGGGMMEVLVSPMLHALPIQKKDSAMSLLHAFYCWGHVGVVLLSTVFFVLFGRENWRWLSLFWAIVPIITGWLFTRVPILHVIAEGQSAMPMRQLFSHRIFYLFIVVMICSGASEQAMGQWASLFAEMGLGVSKTVGDLLGPCLFAVTMGVSRTFYGFTADRLNMQRVLTETAALSVAGYLLAVFSPSPWLSLAGCGVCGLAAGVMWPGALSLVAKKFPLGGTAMFAFLALGGDVGCGLGPAVVGMVSGVVERTNGVETGVKTGLLVATVFPALLFVCMLFLRFRTLRKRVSQ